MEEYSWLIEILLPVAASVAGWLVGRKQRNNSFLAELQGSINTLAAKNADQMDEILKLREEIIKLRSENLAQSQELARVREENRLLNEQMTALRKENQELNEKVSALTEQLSGVRTITKTR